MNNTGQLAAAAPGRSLAAARASIRPDLTGLTGAAAATDALRVLQATGTRAQLSLLPRPGLLR